MKIKKPKTKPMMCEWNKLHSRKALNKEAHAPANVIIGNSHIRLCFGCSKLKKFSMMPIMGYID